MWVVYDGIVFYRLSFPRFSSINYLFIRASCKTLRNEQIYCPFKDFFEEVSGSVW